MYSRDKFFRHNLFIIICLILLTAGGAQFIAQAQSDPQIHPDGWDLSFGEGGVLTKPCDSWGYRLQPDDTILTSCNDNGVYEVNRYTADGQLDTTFGTNGKVSPLSGSLLGTQSDGSIILRNRDADYNVFLTRYSADGVLDNSFGTSGVAVVVPEAVGGVVLGAVGGGVLIQSDGKIIFYDDKGVARFTPDGVLDLTLNNAGYILYSDVLSGPNDSTTIDLGIDSPQFDIDSSGRIYVGLLMIWDNGPFDPMGSRSMVIRLNSDGSLDEAFADGGIYVVSGSGSEQSGNGGLRQILLNQNDDTLLIAKASYTSGSLVRLLPDGRLDPEFNTIPITIPVMGTGLYLARNGYIFHRGLDYRLFPNGLLDNSFADVDVDGNVVGFQSDNSVIVERDDTLSRNVRTKEYSAPPTPTPTPTPFPTSTPFPTQTPFPTPTPTPLPPTERSLALIYAVLDNDLGDEWTRLVNSIEAGAHAGVDVRLMVDGPAIDDANVYTIQPDKNPFCPTIDNPTCNGRYGYGNTYQPFFTEDTARPHALYQFLVDSLNAYPEAPQISLTILGHGSGWGANALPAQPSYWRDQNDTLGGMLWDDHTGVLAGSRSMSTLALGQALQWATNETGRELDLIYLDGCSMGMVEVAYELRNRADYLLASSNTDWATFAYDQLLPLVDHTQDGRTLGEAWLETEAALLNSREGYPFTLALTDLRQIDTLTTTVSTLADAMQAVLPAQKSAIQNAFEQSDRFDSNYDTLLDSADTYIDLHNFAVQLESVGITNTTVISAAQAVQTVVSSIVVSEVHAGGSPWIAPEETWDWQDLGGLSIYAPFHTDEEKRQIYYNAENLNWARDTTWDNLLDAFWAGEIRASSGPSTMSVCHSTIEGCRGLANQLPIEAVDASLVYLPIMR